MPDRGLANVIRDSVTRLRRALRGTPATARLVRPWLRQLARGKPAAAYFTADWGYPVFELPWLMATDLGGTTAWDAQFQQDVVYSTLNGYYYIRMVDDLADGGDGPGPLLMAGGGFHLRFEGAYRRHFPHLHPFWKVLEREWLGGQEAAASESLLKAVGARTFKAVAARKTAAARIPMAAVCYHYGRRDLLQPWFRMTDGVAHFVQMADDLVDWVHDSAAGQATYFLTEGERRRGRRSLARWIADEGTDWALDQCLRWIDEASAEAERLGCPSVSLMLRSRKPGLQRAALAVKVGANSVARLR